VSGSKFNVLKNCETNPSRVNRSRMDARSHDPKFTKRTHRSARSSMFRVQSSACNTNPFEKPESRRNHFQMRGLRRIYQTNPSQDSPAIRLDPTFQIFLRNEPNPKPETRNAEPCQKLPNEPIAFRR